MISTIDCGACVGYMPAGRKGKRAEPFSFALPPFNFTEWEGEGERVSVGRYPLCMPVCREGEHIEHLFLRLRRSIFPNRGVVFSGNLYIRQRNVSWKHASGTGGEAR